MNTHNHWYAYLNPFLRTTPLLCAVLFVPGPPMSTRVCALRIDLPLEFSLLYLPLLMKLAVSQASSNTICVQSRKSCLIYGSITEWELESVSFTYIEVVVIGDIFQWQFFKHCCVVWVHVLWRLKHHISSLFEGWSKGRESHLAG